MAILTVTIDAADETRVKDFFASAYPADSITAIADIQPLLVRFVKGVSRSVEREQNGENAMAAYVDPDVT